MSARTKLESTVGDHTHDLGQNMVDHLVRFDEDQVINAMKELYNDGKFNFFQPTPKPEKLFFHLQLSIRLVEGSEKIIDERFRFHFGHFDPRFSYRFLYSNLDSDSNFLWSTITDNSENSSNSSQSSEI